MGKLAKIYRDEWAWFRDRHLKTFMIVTLIFVGVVALSHAYLIDHPDLAEQKLMELAQKLLEKIPLARGRLVMFVAILLNNLVAATLVLLSGFIPFLFLPGLGIVINAVGMGILTSVLVLKGAALGNVLLFGLVPHGIFEIPAFLYACTLGLGLTIWLVRFILQELFGKPEARKLFIMESPLSGESFLVVLKRTMRTWLRVIVPLLLLAALIEAFVTPILIKTFIGNMKLL